MKLAKGTPDRAPPTGHMTSAEFKAKRPDLKSNPRGGRGTWVRRSAPADRTIEGITFDSKAEAFRFLELRGMQKRGEIDGFCLQPRFPLAGVKFTGDFLVWAKGAVWIEDTKGIGMHEEVVRRFKRNQTQMWHTYGLEVRLVEVKA